MKLEDAAMIADFLGCSLDDLAGRREYVGRFSDPRQNDMNDDYSVLSEPGKDHAAGSVHGIRLAEQKPPKNEPPSNPQQQEGID